MTERLRTAMIIETPKHTIAILPVLVLGASLCWDTASWAGKPQKVVEGSALALFAQIVQIQATPRMVVTIANLSPKSVRIPAFFLEGWSGASAGRQNLRYELRDSTGADVLYRCEVRTGSMERSDYSLLLEPGAALAEVVSGLGCFQLREGEKYRLVVHYVLACPGDGKPPLDSFIGVVDSGPIEFVWLPRKRSEGVPVSPLPRCEPSVETREDVGKP